MEPNKILNAVKEHNLQLSSIITTHHHDDHASGNQGLVSAWKEQTGKDLIVYGGDKRIPCVVDLVADGHKLQIGSGLNVACHATPCHTTGHICYHVTVAGAEQTGAVFTGDTLFIGGCGRFFEGTPEQM